MKERPKHANTPKGIVDLSKAVKGQKLISCHGEVLTFEGYCDPIELIDGQQRLGAVRGFFKDEFKVYGYYYSEFEGKRSIIDNTFSFRMFKIKDRKDLLKFYIELNTGGSIHTETDLKPAYEELKKLEEIF